METYRDAVLVTDRKSASGYCMYSGTNFVIRRSKKQNAVAQSNTDAEFKTMATAAAAAATTIN